MSQYSEHDYKKWARELRRVISYSFEYKIRYEIKRIVRNDEKLNLSELALKIKRRVRNCEKLNLCPRGFGCETFNNSEGVSENAKEKAPKLEPREMS